MAPPRRPVPVQAAPPPPPGVNLFDEALYSGGFTLPEGQYALAFEVKMHAGTKADGTPTGAPRLGVMVTAYPLAGGEPMEQFYSMGTKAALSFAPDPNTGKTVVPIPGGPATTMNDKTNWYLLRKSFIDCGLDPSIVRDLSVLDGMWVHMTPVPEPEERKGFGAQTGEAAEAEPFRNGKVPICTEILQNGKPWEGGGGFEGLGQPVQVQAPAPTTRIPPPKAGPRAVPPKPVPPRPAPVAAQPAAGNGAAVDEDGLATAAIAGVSDVLEKNPSGCTKLLLRTGTFKAISKTYDDATANQVLATYFGSDDNLNMLLGQVGYAVTGVQVAPAAST